MVKISDMILSFKSLDEYSEYTKKKYTNSNTYISDNMSDKKRSQVTVDNGFYILSLLIKSKDVIINGPSLYVTVDDPIFKKEYKGFFLGCLNQSRSYIDRYLKQLILNDGNIELVLDRTQFKSFEMGILIDTKYDERGSYVLRELLKIQSM